VRTDSGIVFLGVVFLLVALLATTIVLICFYPDSWEKVIAGWGIAAVSILVALGYSVFGKGDPETARGGAMDGFLEREVPRLGGRRLYRLGLSGSFGLDESASREALERANYVFWSPRMKGLTPALKDALRRDRDRYVVSAGPLFGWFPGSVRNAVEDVRPHRGRAGGGGAA
jgi:hypothetical protein